ncbi:adenylate kinase, partial [Blyttiomyces sp. JEL0837]
MLTPPQLPAVPPNGGKNLDQIIESIPLPKCVEQAERPFIVIMGQPGCGASSLASRIAASMVTELINPDTLLTMALGPNSFNTSGSPSQEVDEAGAVAGGEQAAVDQAGASVEGDGAVPPATANADSGDNAFSPEIFHHILAGKEVESSVILNLYEKAMSSDPVLFKGAVVDGLPFSTFNGTEKSETEGTFIDLEALKSLIQNHLLRRRKCQWTDPKTGKMYPGAQVEYSRRRRAEGWNEEMPDVEAENAEVEEEETWKFEDEEVSEKPKDDMSSEEDGSGDMEGGNEDEEGEDEEGSTELKKRKKRKPNEPKVFNLSNKTVWSILSQEVLDRPEDTHDNITKELQKHEEKLDALEDLRVKHFDALHVINLDATQHPDLLVRNALDRIDSLGIFSLNKPVPAKRLLPPEGGFKGMSDADSMKYLATFELEEGEPVREVSNWGRYCPVTYCEEDNLVQAPLTWPVSYRGFIYFTYSEYHLNRFMMNPDAFLARPPMLPSLRICVLGGPFTGKSTQSQMLAKIYGLKLLSLDDILTAWDYERDQQGLIKQNALYATVVKRCKSGKSLPPEVMIQVIKSALDGDAKADDKSTGWVLDGFPRTIDDAKAMLAENLIPQHTIILKNDINDEAVRIRHKFFQANSRTGRVWNEKALHVRAPAPPQVSTFGTPAPPTAAPTNARATPATTTPHRNIKTPNTPGITSNAVNQESSLGTPAKSIQDHFTDVVSLEEEETKATNLSPFAMPPQLISMYPYFDNLYNGFKEEFVELVKLLEGNDSTIINIGADQSIPTVLSIIQTAVDPFLPKAEALTGSQIAELPEVFEYGCTKEFCPFALRQVNILQKGSSEYAVKYMGQIYHMSGEEARTAFLIEPHNFVSLRHPIKPPPPRLFFLGASGSGKSICMQSLAQWEVPILTFKELVDRFAKTAEKEVREEIEYMFRENAGLLSPVIVQDIITSLFTEEPFVSKGFILEGFPRTKVEAEVLIKHNLHVDAFVALRVDSDVAAKRIISERTKDSKKAKAEALSALANAGDVADESLKNQLKEAEKALDHIENQTDEVTEELIDKIEKENLRISEVIGAVDGFWTVPVIEIDCNKFARPVIGTMKKMLRPFFENRASIFSNAVSVTQRVADTLLRLGIKSYSPFGKICPVSWKRKNLTLKRPIGKFPVLYRDHIYFLKTEQFRKEFLENTLEFTAQHPPQPVVRPRICVIGRPKAGKSTLASKLCAEYDMVHLTIPNILQSIVSGKENTDLCDK